MPTAIEDPLIKDILCKNAQLMAILGAKLQTPAGATLAIGYGKLAAACGTQSETTTLVLDAGKHPEPVSGAAHCAYLATLKTDLQNGMSATQLTDAAKNLDEYTEDHLTPLT